MKMIYNGTPMKSMKVNHYEVSTQDCTAIPSDLQAGITCVSKGKKITGTGKSFEFATYGKIQTNLADYIPSKIIVIEIASIDYPIKSLIAFDTMHSIDFSIEQTIGAVIVDNIEYPVTAKYKDSLLTLNCEKTIYLEVFLGKDNYYG